MSNPVTMLVLGGGDRGTTYSDWALRNPDRARVVGVAEPDDERRERFARKHGLGEGQVFRDWREALDQPKMADLAIISTQDAMHVDPSVQAAGMGYALLLEKPMAPDPAGCRTIVEAVEAAGVPMAVCHVMRYTDYTQALLKLLADGAIGKVWSIDHVEPVGHWHMAHSFIRGKWRREDESSPMLLAKSCHDMDWIRYVMGSPIERVSSFGRLSCFTSENQPVGATDRCLDCPLAESCAYSATRIYLDAVRGGKTGWPLTVVAAVPSVESITEALREGPYGRCVWACDNDVVDHQVVNLEFADGQTGTFTMTGFTQMGHRRTMLFGTDGEIRGDGTNIDVTDFRTGETRRIDTSAADSSITGGHGGGDFGLVESLTEALSTGDMSKILSGPAESLETHLAVFAAETARHNRTVEEVAKA